MIIDVNKLTPGCHLNLNDLTNFHVAFHYHQYGEAMTHYFTSILKVM